MDELAHRVYFHVAMQLDLGTLLQCDATCRSAREANRSIGGRWQSLGGESFLGLELCGEGPFDQPTNLDGMVSVQDWKQRYTRFLVGSKLFAAPFYRSAIDSVANEDEVAYFRCLLRTDLLAKAPSSGVYLEVEVCANPDNLSLALSDFDDAGSSSLTFSPDTGAVISECKVCENPRKVQGMYVQPLEALATDSEFQGRVGLFLQGGRVAFFRRFCGKGNSEPGVWESTGFVSDLAWAEGRRLTPCIAFRSAGEYKVRTTYVGSTPPFLPSVMGKEQGLEWCPLDWEAPDADDLQEPQT